MLLNNSWVLAAISTDMCMHRQSLHPHATLPHPKLVQTSHPGPRNKTKPIPPTLSLKTPNRPLCILARSPLFHRIPSYQHVARIPHITLKYQTETNNRHYFALRMRRTEWGGQITWSGVGRMKCGGHATALKCRKILHNVLNVFAAVSILLSYGTPPASGFKSDRANDDTTLNNPRETFYTNDY